MTTAPHRRWAFWVAFAAATVIIAGIVSYFASSSPDGLDSATLKGCEVVEVDGAEELTGSCIAQNAKEHAMSASPLADYAVEGNKATSGIAGIIGVLVTVAVAGGAFWLIARTNKPAKVKPTTTTGQ
ncbi:PDGLE domain-containing protein [Mycolicibacterium komossense]|uniref:PDGLE domain-containing protein n=1 Tax=Mycolicibacterium komossense TaxID=1779 RepID=A0ABT3CGW0_9MYCO|nr:PDGLE domain-containing protein [Mycolicibacterium komossense]MCV7228466.1 PDGLE domain-containing protein [Mycolicibacterium komossense]